MVRASWLPEGWQVSVPRALLVALGCTVFIAVLLLATVSTTAFGLYNPTWEGTSDLREQIDTGSATELDVITDTTEYDTLDSDETVAFVIAPDEPYDSAAAEQMRQFVSRGGTVVVFENFEPQGNVLLSALGVDTRFDGRVIRDEQQYFKGPEMPLATTVENHTLTTGVDQLTLNLATALEPGNATVLVRSSEFAYLVDDPDEGLDDDDELATYPVATVESLGSGTVVAVGDPSITINAMVGEPNNAAFLEQLYSGTDRVMFDLSHQGSVPPLTSVVLTIRETPLLQTLLGGIAIVTVAGVSRGQTRRLRDRLHRTTIWEQLRQRTGRRLATDRQTMATDERAAYLRQQHPDWDEDRIERIVTAFNRTKEQDSKRE
ncbi:protein of unknown function [Halovenus aranensis]|uniref:DUF4350 domain-containing protein n=1 Tax=Halovenus aranensis TaxID=890420 RepID=A0A1G8ZAZ2_9EURY|nr:DUF4350 domain-containing protein [Halovenus aranensis]SDK11330.1 protein of unknown function [Halovenus aranensis]